MHQRRRPVTSCSECYKRKQKCNRRKPCNHCSSRSVEDRCVYYEEIPYITSIQPTSSIPAIDDENNISQSLLGEARTTELPQHFIYRLGYSSTARNGALLHQLEHLTGHSLSHAPHKDENPERKQQENLIALLPSHHFISLLLDFFFAGSTYFSWLVDEHCFRARYNEWHKQTSVLKVDRLTRDLQYLPASLFQILAQAVDRLPVDHPTARSLQLYDYRSCDRLAQVFHAAGEKLMQHLGRHNPAFSSIEHDLLSAVWLKTSGKGVETWKKVGSAIIQAQELGLHNLPTLPDTSLGNSLMNNLAEFWNLESRKRLWCRLFIVDSLALALGRPRLIHREDTTTPDPFDCDFPQNTSIEVPISNTVSSFSPTLALLESAHIMHDVLSGMASHAFVNDYNKLIVLHQKLINLQQTLPRRITRLNPSRGRLEHLSISNQIYFIIVALHRPFINTSKTSCEAAIEAALNQLQCQQELFELYQYPQYKLYTTAFYTIDAAIFLAGVATGQSQYGSYARDRILASIFKAIERLGQIRDQNNLACSGERVLRHFYEMIQAVPVPEIQQTPSRHMEADHDPFTLPFPTPDQSPRQNFVSLFGPVTDTRIMPRSTGSDLHFSETDFQDMFGVGGFFEYLTYVD